MNELDIKVRRTDNGEHGLEKAMESKIRRKDK
jgi:hypothetical protein